jgi:hypothetical protein
MKKYILPPLPSKEAAEEAQRLFDDGSGIVPNFEVQHCLNILLTTANEKAAWVSPPFLEYNGVLHDMKIFIIDE